MSLLIKYGPKAAKVKLQIRFVTEGKRPEFWLTGRILQYCSPSVYFPCSVVKAK